MRGVQLRYRSSMLAPNCSNLCTSSVLPSKIAALSGDGSVTFEYLLHRQFFEDARGDVTRFLCRLRFLFADFEATCFFSNVKLCFCLCGYFAELSTLSARPQFRQASIFFSTVLFRWCTWWVLWAMFFALFLLCWVFLRAPQFFRAVYSRGFSSWKVWGASFQDNRFRSWPPLTWTISVSNLHWGQSPCCL